MRTVVTSVVGVQAGQGEGMWWLPWGWLTEKNWVRDKPTCHKLI